MGPLLSASTNASAKISIVCLYRRIFPTDTLRIKRVIVMISVTIYWIVCILGCIFGCVPVKAAWTITTAHCLDLKAFFLATELYNCILDIVILSLPISELRKLHMPLRHKIGVGFVFLLGGL